MSRGMAAAAAATSVLSFYGAPALADAQADGIAKNSSGFMSGNVVQVPVNAPVNACGNTVDAAAALNPSFGNKCRQGHDDHGYGSGYGSDDDSGYGSGYGSDDDSGYGSGYGSDEESGYGDDDGPDSGAYGESEGSSGVGSGNAVQVPVDSPVNACGNTVDAVGALNPVAGTKCEQGGYGHDETPPKSPPDGHTPPADDEEKSPPSDDEEEENTPSDEEESPEPAGEEGAPPAEDGDAELSLPKTGAEGMLGAGAASAVLIAGGVLLYRRSRAAATR
ncbi:chaplin family protein [Streptomyces sp. NPDC000134]|uniref:chaplin n=1 Tax=Streptomyces sp. NPDC000134 TaxID=3364536 RepID=UPI003687DAF2